MAKGPKGPIVTKKHLARVERERIQTRNLIIASILILVVVVGLIGYGILKQYLITPNQPVAKVAGESVSTRDFQTYGRYTRLQLIQQYQQYQQLAQMFGSDPQNSSFIQQYLSQIEFQMEPTILGQTVLDRLIEDRIIRAEAAARGISVTSEEVDKAVEDFFSYYPAGTPTVAPTTVAIPTSTLNPTQLALVPPTSTPTVTPIITPTQVITQVQSTATLTATLTPTVAPTETPSGPTATPLPQPTATEYTEQQFQTNYDNYVTNLGSLVGITEKDMRWILEMQIYRQKVYDVITADIPREQEQVWARHIVVPDEATAQEALTRIENGEDFAILAMDVYTSTDTSSRGGDLGWFSVGEINADEEKIVFNLAIGEISDPIQTPNGWAIIQALGHEVRQLTDDQYQQALGKSFQEWLDRQRSVMNVEIFDIWQERVPTYPTIPPTQ